MSVNERVLGKQQDRAGAASMRERVVVVGGGPAGLAVAAVLKSKGVDALVLDRADEIGRAGRATTTDFTCTPCAGCPTCPASGFRAAMESGWRATTSSAT